MHVLVKQHVVVVVATATVATVATAAATMEFTGV